MVVFFLDLQVLKVVAVFLVYVHDASCATYPTCSVSRKYTYIGNIYDLSRYPVDKVP